eukprot:365480-Chlamydomonas_euryale.AAC.23
MGKTGERERGGQNDKAREPPPSSVPTWAPRVRTWAGCKGGWRVGFKNAAREPLTLTLTGTCSWARVGVGR